MVDYSTNEKKKAFSNYVNKLIDSNKLGSGAAAIIFAAKAREHTEVRNRMKVYERPENILILCGAIGSTPTDISYILEHTDELTKIKMISKTMMQYGFFSKKSEDTTEIGRNFVRECSDILTSIQYRSVDYTTEDPLNNIWSIRRPLRPVGKPDNLLNMLLDLFQNGDESTYLFHKVLRTSDNYSHHHFHAYNDLIYNLITAVDELDLDFIDNRWIEKEKIISRSGKDLFIDNDYDNTAFTHMFRVLMQASQKIANKENGEPVIANVIKERIKSYSRFIMSELSKGVNESLLIFGDRNSKTLINPFGSNILRFVESVVVYGFSSEFKSSIAEKIAVSLSNGNTKSISSINSKAIIDLVSPLVDWEKVVGSLNSKGKAYIIKNASDRSVFEPYLDRNSRSTVLREDLNL